MLVGDNFLLVIQYYLPSNLKLLYHPLSKQERIWVFDRSYWGMALATPHFCIPCSSVIETTFSTKYHSLLSQYISVDNRCYNVITPSMSYLIKISFSFSALCLCASMLVKSQSFLKEKNNLVLFRCQCGHLHGHPAGWKWLAASLCLHWD